MKKSLLKEVRIDMAYSDYGGYAFKNGVHIPNRSDVTISDDSNKCFNISGHVVLGNTVMVVSLHKQQTLNVWYERTRLSEKKLSEYAVNLPKNGFDGDYIDVKEVMRGLVCSTLNFRFPNEARLSVLWANLDNYYMFVRLRMPNLDVWTGWSGYGVGMGVRNEEYGTPSDAEMNKRLCQVWPDAINEEGG